MKMLKLTLLLILVAVDLPCFAGSPGPQAFGPLKFGMSREEADKALEKIENEIMRRKQVGYTGAFVRKNFVSDGTKSPSKVSSSKDKMQFAFSFKRAPETLGLASVTVSSDKHSAAVYDQAAKEAWEVLRDIGQAKFGAPKQGAGTGSFPALASLDGTEGKKSVVTDVWETRDGVRVELSVDAGLPSGDPGFLASVALKATEMGK